MIIKKKIFKFIIKSVDAFKIQPEKFVKDLNIILKQVKVNFKEMVKQKVGNTEDVQNFLKKKDCSYYIENNYKNNKYIIKNKFINENNIEIKEKKINYNIAILLCLLAFFLDII
jgi:hypothetical protein